MNTEIKLSIRQVQEMRHAIGGKVIGGHRNYFNTGRECDSWKELVELGFAWKTDQSKALGGVYYHVTEEGIKALKRMEV